MSLTEESLKEIAITVDDISVLENFKDPILDETYTHITFIPKRDNLIDVPSGTKVVKVTIPETFYYEKEGTKVYLNQEFNYSFKINSKTETSAEITVSCLSSAGDLSYSGTKLYYLDNSFTVSCTPKEAYSLAGWTAKYEDGNNIEENILQTTVSQDYKTITVTVLTGSEKSITIEPVLVERGVLVVNFKSEHGSTIPQETRKYYLGDTFTINYREESDYCFTNWKVTEVSNKDAAEILNIKNLNKLETECEVLKTDTSIVIEAVSALRPKVLAMTPSYDNAGVFRDSSIKIIFSQEMSIHSIYWTKAEMDEMNIPESYRLKAGNYKDKNGNSYYHGYKEQGDESKTVFKNIVIKNRTDNQNLLNCFDAPYYSSDDNTILIIPSKSDTYTDPGIDVQVSIAKDFSDSFSIPMAGSFTGCYFTNATVDTVPPTIEITKIAIGTRPYESAEIANFPTEIPYYEYDQVNDELFQTAMWTEARTESKTLYVRLWGTVVDGGSKPSRVEVSVEPVATWATKADNEALRISKSVNTPLLANNGDTSDFSGKNLSFNFNLSNYKMIEGGYRIVIKAYDNRDNCKTYEHQIPLKYNDGITPKVSKDDIFGKLMVTEETYQNCTISVRNIDNCRFAVAFIALGQDAQHFGGLPFISTREEIRPFELYEKLKEKNIPKPQDLEAGYLGTLYWLRVRDIWNNYNTVLPNYIGYGECPEISSVSGNAFYGRLLEVIAASGTNKIKKGWLTITSDEISDFSEMEVKINGLNGHSSGYEKPTLTQENNTWCFEFADPVECSKANYFIRFTIDQLREKKYTASVYVEDEWGYKSNIMEQTVN